MNQLSELRVIDLFAGCGGMSLGFQNAGFRVAAAFDSWQAAIKVYRQNFSHPIHEVDLSDQTIDYEQFVSCKPFMIIGGPPCQDFSHAGKRDEELGRADLTIAFARIIANVKPQLFVMENVDRAIKSKRLAIARELLSREGYALTEQILDASLCGVPQKRKRMFLIGELASKDNFLDRYLDRELATQPLTVRQYFIDHVTQDFTLQYYYRHPRNYSRRAVYSVDEPSATIRGVNRPIPATYTTHSADASPINPSVRPLTTLERAYIQTFPFDFAFTGTKSDVEQMIGNAVPVKLAEYVARAILDYLLDRRFGQEISVPIQLKLFESAQNYVTSVR